VVSARRTLAAPAWLGGIGLFTGARTSVWMLPSESGGIVFRTAGRAGDAGVRAWVGNVVSEQRRTVLQAEAGGIRVQTVEHILSALAGMGVTDAVIEVTGPEIPIGDGSALMWTDAIGAAGVVGLAGQADVVRIEHPMTLGERGEPGCEYVYKLDYGPGFPVPAQEARFFMPLAGDAAGYSREVAPARTFSTQAEAEAAQKMGMFTQFTPRDMLVIGPQGPVDNELRFPTEPAMHKVLDLIGDVSLCGRCVVGRVVATRSGHALNHKVAQALASLAV
jgi:UDP-3-O-acyl-N-acetylglucosamine deacetylase